MVIALENEDWEIRELNKRVENQHNWLTNTKCWEGNRIV